VYISTKSNKQYIYFVFLLKILIVVPVQGRPNAVLLQRRQLAANVTYSLKTWKER